MRTIAPTWIQPGSAALIPAWVDDVYTANNPVTHNGLFWISNTTTSAEPGTNGDWTQYPDFPSILKYILDHAVFQ